MPPTFPQILLLIDIEQSYINTNHEDFIGFAKYVLFGTAAMGWCQIPWVGWAFWDEVSGRFAWIISSPIAVVPTASPMGLVV